MRHFSEPAQRRSAAAACKPVPATFMTRVGWSLCTYQICKHLKVVSRETRLSNILTCVVVPRRTMHVIVAVAKGDRYSSRFIHNAQFVRIIYDRGSQILSLVHNCVNSNDLISLDRKINLNPSLFSQTWRGHSCSFSVTSSYTVPLLVQNYVWSLSLIMLRQHQHGPEGAQPGSGRSAMLLMSFESATIWIADTRWLWILVQREFYCSPTLVPCTMGEVCFSCDDLYPHQICWSTRRGRVCVTLYWTWKSHVTIETI